MKSEPWLPRAFSHGLPCARFYSFQLIFGHFLLVEFLLGQQALRKLKVAQNRARCDFGF